MAFCFSRLATAVLLLASSGCWTGMLVESGRLHERVRSYESFVVDGEELLLDYTVEISRSPWGAKSKSLGHAKRAVAVSLVELDASPPHPPISFPLRHIRPHGRAIAPLPFRMTPQQPELERPIDVQGGTREPATAEITLAKGRHHGFRLCFAAAEERAEAQASSDSRAEVACRGYFHSAALYDNRLAWWVYTAAPFTMLVDVALIPFQLLTLPPLIALSD